MATAVRRDAQVRRQDACRPEGHVRLRPADVCHVQRAVPGERPAASRAGAASPRKGTMTT